MADGDAVVGLISDRDLVVRGLAQGAGGTATVGQLVTGELCWIEAG